MTVSCYDPNLDQVRMKKKTPYVSSEFEPKFSKNENVPYASSASELKGGQNT